MNSPDLFIAPYESEYPLDERPEDRTVEGVLLRRWAGEPTGPQQWGAHRTRRQFEVMGASPPRCAGCEGPAHRDERGALWILHTPGTRLTGSLAGPILVTTPPVCLTDAARAVQSCTAVHEGAVALRVTEAEVVGVRGTVYSPIAPPVRNEIVRFDDPRAERVIADALVREISCAEADTTTLPSLTSARARGSRCPTSGTAVTSAPSPASCV
ncbi:hypothetical protein [Streptomyces sp. NPDC088775]|uniref:hypothetical protein n=1 Tax=Streptomyces sp. NPDC088775 TaxID=3365896 RepID=UPI0037F8B4EE